MAKRKNVGSMPVSKLRTFNSLDELSDALQQLIGSELDNFAQNEAKNVMQEVLEENVYSYIPNYYPVTRRRENGGLLDTGYMFAAAGRHGNHWELRMTNYAPWHNQKIGRGGINKSLADAIESGDGMHGAGARPFYQDTEERIAERLDEYFEYAAQFI